MLSIKGRDFTFVRDRVKFRGSISLWRSGHPGTLYDEVVYEAPFRREKLGSTMLGLGYCFWCPADVSRAGECSVVSGLSVVSESCFVPVSFSSQCQLALCRVSGRGWCQLWLCQFVVLGPVWHLLLG